MKTTFLITALVGITVSSFTLTGQESFQDRQHRHPTGARQPSDAAGLPPNWRAATRAPKIAVWAEAAIQADLQMAGLPLTFEPNEGQAPDGVQFLARGSGYGLLLSPTELVLHLKASASEVNRLRMHLVNADPQARISGQEPLPTKVNYFHGADPSAWRGNLSTYARIRYEQVYPGVDLVFYGNQGCLEYDYVVAPGADPGRIGLRFEGAEAVSLNAQGELLIRLGARDVSFHKPVVYQEMGGVRQQVAGQFVIKPPEDGAATAATVSFRLGAYDTTRPLVIDPVLAYATYLGGGNQDQGGISFDAAGNMYTSGETASANFPQAAPALAGGDDIFVCKFNAAGTALLWTTLLGGSGDELGGIVSIDASGNVFVGGETSSTNFPTHNAAQPAFGQVRT